MNPSNLNEPANSPDQEPSFFTEEQLNFFIEWQKKAYDKTNPDHIAAKNYLMETVWEKTLYLGRQVNKQFPDFVLDGKKTWHQRGWKEQEDGSNTQAAIIKPYTWVKMFRKADKEKDIFFTFGLDAFPNMETFVYKIDCQRTRDSKLSESQLTTCQRMIPPPDEWGKITFAELIGYDWKRLIDECVQFVRENIKLYDKVIAAAWGEQNDPESSNEDLQLQNRPAYGIDVLPEINRTYKGYNIDHEQQSKEQKDLGDKGQELVIAYESNQLRKNGFHTKADLVRSVKDGEGFDVLSFDDQGNDKFIEVKTTRGNENTPFFMSANELDFMRDNDANYFIYRIYNYDEAQHVGKFFILRRNIHEELLMQPIQYKIFLKPPKAD